jgi:preprotein translocase subunit SecG
METFFTILIIIAAILLGLVVLAQNPKGGGLAQGFGNASQLGGVRNTTDFLDKATWTLSSIVAVLCLISSFMTGTGGASRADKNEVEPTLTEAPPAFNQAPIENITE